MTRKYQEEELGINRSLNVRVKCPNHENPKVIEVAVSMYAVPKTDKTEEEYEMSVKKIRRTADKSLRKYVKAEDELFDDKIITDYTFTSTNLKRNRNKYVVFSVFIRQKNDYPYFKIRKKIRDSIKECTFEISNVFHEEEFSCYKKKHKEK